MLFAGHINLLIELKILGVYTAHQLKIGWMKMELEYRSIDRQTDRYACQYLVSPDVIDFFICSANLQQIFFEFLFCSKYWCQPFSLSNN